MYSEYFIIINKIKIYTNFRFNFSLVLFNTLIEGEFIKPSLTFSKKTLNFRYLWSPSHQPDTYVKDLEITNVGSLPTNFFLNVDKPFSVNDAPISLNPRIKSKNLIFLKISF